MSLCISISLCLGGVHESMTPEHTIEDGYARRGFIPSIPSIPATPQTAVSVMNV